MFLAEDDVPFCYAAQRALELAGFQVAAYNNSTEAWDAVGINSGLDLFLTDIIFPPGQPNGAALIKSARYNHPNLPIIVMTAYADSLGIGPDENILILYKPVDLTTLAATVSGLLTNTGH